jgi:[acyl-carrier-protein] S-malonyltransferase
MLADLAASYPEVNIHLNARSDALGKTYGLLSQNGPEDELNQTHNTQPAMLAAGLPYGKSGAPGHRPSWDGRPQFGRIYGFGLFRAMSLEDGINWLQQEAG